jgi:ferritin-like metal-binding protein YciE
VEHYEISRYGTLRTWAEELGLNDAASLLQETLDEEKATDEALLKLRRGL